MQQLCSSIHPAEKASARCPLARRHFAKRQFKMRRDVEKRVAAATGDTAAEEPRPFQQLLVGSVTHQVGLLPAQIIILIITLCQQMSPPTTLMSHSGRMSLPAQGTCDGLSRRGLFCTHASDVQRRLRRCWCAQAKRGRRVTALLRVWRPTEELQAAQEGDLLIASRLLALRRSAGGDRCATRGDTVW